MDKLVSDTLDSTMRCPRCRSPLAVGDNMLACVNPPCGARYKLLQGQPVLIDFEQSALVEEDLQARDGDSELRRGGLLKLISRLLSGNNPVARRYSIDLLSRLKAKERRRLLIIGGGEMGKGTSALYEANFVERVGSDIYASPLTTLLADAHSLPFADGAFDAVWIQAVLEHVLDPALVVSEIERVLAPGGIVFADTPFMWPVHEGAWDFTRWTMNGYRWLFRGFDEIESGYSSGAGQNLILAIRYAVRAWTGSGAVALLVVLPFFWLRYLDRFGKRRAHLDSAAGLYFYGVKSEQKMRADQLSTYYEGQTSQDRTRTAVD